MKIRELTILVFVLVFFVSGVVGAETAKKLVVWDWPDPYRENMSGPMDIVLEQYQKENPNVELEIEQITNGSLRSKLLAAAFAKNLPDVAYLDGQWLAELQETGMLAPLTSFANKWGQSDDFPKKIWESALFDNEVYGIPGDGDVRTLVYRKDLMKKAGLDPNKPPQTWKDLVSVSRKVMEAGRGEGLEYGFALNGGDSEHTSMRSLPWIWDLGGDLIDENGNPALNSEPVIQTVRFMKDLVLKYQVSPEDSYLRTKKEVANSVLSGQSAMAIIGSWEWNGDTHFLGQENLKEHFASAPLPLPTNAVTVEPYTAVGYGVWVIFADSKVKEEAWKWIEKVTSVEHEVNIFKDGTGNMPLRMSAYEDPVFSSDPIFKSFIDILPNARPRPKTVNYELLSQAYRLAIQEALTDQKSVQEALDEAQQKVEAEWK